MRAVRWITVAAVALTAGCSAHAPPPPPAPPPPSAAASAPAAAPSAAAPATAVLVGAGDIATCDGRDDDRTADLVANTPGIVFTLGDNAYRDGTPREFERCYGPGGAGSRTGPAR